MAAAASVRVTRLSVDSAPRNSSSKSAGNGGQAPVRSRERRRAGVQSLQMLSQYLKSPRLTWPSFLLGLRAQLSVPTEIEYSSRMITDKSRLRPLHGTRQKQALVHARETTNPVRKTWPSSRRKCQRHANRSETRPPC